MTIITTLPAWVYGPFEMLVNAELHYQARKDFDRRMALISFDNAIEVSISNYLSLHPRQRGGKTYQKADVERWKANFPALMDFVDVESAARGVTPSVDIPHMIYYHNMRNEQYHEGRTTVPNQESLVGIRTAAYWIFEMLYDVPDVQARVQARIDSMRPPKPEPEEALDRLLDAAYPPVKFGSQEFRASELLFGFDPDVYRELAGELRAQQAQAEALSPTDQLKLDYWRAFKEYVSQHAPDLTTPSAMAVHWMDFSVFWKRGFFLGARINTRENVLTFGFYNTLPKAVFRYLYAQHEIIDEEIGEPLDWDINIDRKQSQAEVRLAGVDLRDRQQWTGQFEWFVKQYRAFSAAFIPRVRGMDVDALVNSES